MPWPLAGLGRREGSGNEILLLYPGLQGDAASITGAVTPRGHSVELHHFVTGAVRTEPWNPRTVWGLEGTRKITSLHPLPWAGSHPAEGGVDLGALPCLPPSSSVSQGTLSQEFLLQRDCSAECGAPAPQQLPSLARGRIWDDV